MSWCLQRACSVYRPVLFCTHSLPLSSQGVVLLSCHFHRAETPFRGASSCQSLVDPKFGQSGYSAHTLSDITRCMRLRGMTAGQPGQWEGCSEMGHVCWALRECPPHPGGEEELDQGGWNTAVLGSGVLGGKCVKGTAEDGCSARKRRWTESQ